MAQIDRKSSIASDAIQIMVTKPFSYWLWLLISILILLSASFIQQSLTFIYIFILIYLFTEQIIVFLLWLVIKVRKLGEELFLSFSIEHLYFCLIM